MNTNGAILLFDPDSNYMFKINEFYIFVYIVLRWHGKFAKSRLLFYK
jgi:hypothetical protein